jgi:hypothetical protein
MADFVLSVFANNAAALETKFNTAFALLLSNGITDIDFNTGDMVRYNGFELQVVARYNDTGVVINNPYKLKTFTGTNLNAIETAAQAFIAAHPAYWFGPFRSGYLSQSRNASLYIGYLIYNEVAADGSQNWATGGSGASSLYTNPTPTPATIGGIAAGSTFLDQTMQQMWDSLLYPYQVPAFSSFSITGESSPMEVGDTIPASVTFTWATTNSTNVQANSISILDITGGLTLATGLANDGSEAVVRPGATTLTAAGSYVFRIGGVNSLLAAFTRNLTFEWRWREYWGANINATLTEAQIEALANSGLTTGVAGSYSMAAGGYKYICIANAVGGQINTVKDSTTLLNVPMATVADDPAYSNVDGGGFSYALVAVTNVFGVLQTYRVYRTQNILGAAITLLVT